MNYSEFLKPLFSENIMLALELIHNLPNLSIFTREESTLLSSVVQEYSTNACHFRASSMDEKITQCAKIISEKGFIEGGDPVKINKAARMILKAAIISEKSKKNLSSTEEKLWLADVVLIVN